METLKDILDKYTLNEVEQQLRLFVASAEDYQDVLKLSLALVFVLKQSVELLSQQDLSSYPDLVRQKLEKAQNDAKQSIAPHQERFKADSDLMRALQLSEDNTIKKLSSNITQDLYQCEQIMKQLVDSLQNMPTEEMQQTISS